MVGSDPFVKAVLIRSQVFRAAACGMLLLLAGCPGASGDLGGNSGPVAGFQTVSTVQGIQGGTRTCRVPANSDQMVQRLLQLVNEERDKYGLHPLTLNPLLSKIADDYCCAMIEGNFFDHTNPYTQEGPGQRAINGGYVFRTMGENLAGGQASPEQAMEEWMASTRGHRENILAVQWREIGIGVRTGGEFGVYWVQEFGDPP